jgi:hypothetical protein
MTPNVENVVLPGPVRVFLAPWVEGSIETPPADTVAYGDAWGGDWVDIGYTKGGGTVKIAEEAYSVQADQQKQPILDRKTSENATVEVVMLEATLANLKKAIGLGTITVGSTVTSFGSDGDETQPTYLTVGLEHYGPGSSPGAPKYRRTFIWKAMPKPNAELKSAPNEEQVIASMFEARYEANAPAGYKKLYHFEDLN